ncbi:MAG: oligosaccharide flippase family protein [Pyrinomonadaceae bacterium]
MSAENKNTSLKAQSAWLLFAKIAGFVLSFLLPLVVVRVLAKSEYGVYQQAFRVLVVAVGVLPIGISMSAFYYLSRDEAKRASTIFNILIFNFIVGGLAFAFLFLFPQSLGNLMTSNEIGKLAPIIGFAIWVWLFSTFLEVIAVANNESVLATGFIIFAQFTKSTFMILAVLVFGTVESLIWGAIVQGLLQTTVLMVYVNKRFPRFWTTFNTKFFKEQLIYAVPLGIAGILWMLQTEVHYFFVSHRFSDTEYAIYAAGCFQLPLVTMLAESVVSVLIPKMSALQLKGDTREMVRITFRAMQTLALLFLPIYVFLFITAELFISTLFTNRFESSVSIFRVFLTLLPFHIFISDPLFRVFQKMGRYLVLARIVSGAILVAWLFYGIKHYSLTGIIAIVVFVRITEMILAELFIFSRIGVTKYELKSLYKIVLTGFAALIAGLIMFGAAKYVQAPVYEFVLHTVGNVYPPLKNTLREFIAGVFALSVLALIYGIAYFGFVTAFSAMNESDKRTITNLFNKVLGRFLSIRGSEA